MQNKPQVETVGKKRSFWLTNLAVDNSTSIVLITLMILLFGVLSYTSMPKEQFPEASLPQIFVNTPYFGYSAPDIEDLITRPIERELQTVSGIKNVTSNSLQDFSSIVAEFNANIEQEEALRKVKDAVDKARSNLPNDLQTDPEILEINFSDIPIVTINLSGNYNMDELRSFAEYLEDQLEDINEVSRAVMKGALEKEVKVDVDMLKMQALQVSFQDIENAISFENMSMSAGELVADDFRRALRVVGQFDNISEIEDIIVKSENQRPIILKNFASVSMGFKERTSYARSDGFPVISLDVIKRKGENLLNASDRIKETVNLAQAEMFPEDLKIELFNDQSINTRTQVSNLENSIISGVILVTLVLLFFLGFRNSLFVGMAIPLSMLTGILWLNLSGVTMNIVVLFALILALGLLVDNAIVVVENIYRYMQNKHNSKDAAKRGAAEVAVPIIASTATTLAAFLPLAFWPGIMGKFMYYLPITLIIVLTSSLFVALVINPVLTSLFMKVDEMEKDVQAKRRKTKNILLGVFAMLIFGILSHIGGIEWLRNILGFGAVITLLNYFLLGPASIYFQSNVIPILEKIYDKFIRFALKKYNPGLFFIGTFFLLILASMLLFSNAPKIDLFPSADPVYVNVFVDLPLGRDIEATNKIMKEIEAKVSKTLEPYDEVVEAVLSQIGENTSDPNSPPEPGASPHKARLTVSFVPYEDRAGVSTREIMEELRFALQGYPGVKIIVDKNADGPPAGKPINIELSGPEIDRLAILSNEIIDHINEQSIPGIEELKADVRIGKPEAQVIIDRKAARRYELSTGQIGDAIRTSVFGKEVSKFKVGEDDYPIQMRLDERYRNNVYDLLTQKITFRNPANGQIAQVPISAVADVDFTSTYSSIKRKNQNRVITVYSNVLDGYNANEIVAEIKDLLSIYTFPANYKYEFTGEQQQQAEDMSFLMTSLLIAIFGIFIILVSQFNSLISPFIIIISVVFSWIGVLLGYVFTGRDISVIFTGVGIISLAGVVVNNAIVLLDYINLLIKEKRLSLGMESMNELSFEQVKEAIIKGGATRLRPVLLTAITTILGLIPLAIGFNFNFFTLITDLDPNFFLGGDNTAIWGPMAWTVIYGLVFATFLTLIIVPVMYWIAFRMKYSFMSLLGGNKKPKLETAITE